MVMLSLRTALLTFYYLINSCHCDNLCGLGWTNEGDSCYMYAGKKMTWLDSKLHCDYLNAHLPTIKTVQDWNGLSSFRSTINNVNYDDNIWLSANAYFNLEGVFQWHDKSVVNDTWTNWFRPATPNNISYPEPSPVGCRFCCPWNYCDLPGACAASLGSYDVYYGAWATTSCDSAKFQTICVKPTSGNCQTLGVKYGNVSYSDITCQSATTCKNGTSATLTCANSTSSSQFQCYNNTWLPRYPTCNASCIGITSINTINVTFFPPVIGSLVDEMTNVSIVCASNSTPFRNVRSARCIDGSWYPSTPVCVPHCLSLSIDSNGNISYSDSNYAMNSQATLTCNPSYAVNDSDGQPQTSKTIFCQNTSWIETMPQCQSMCGFKPCLNNGTCTIDPFKCTCPLPYSGTYCEIHSKPCYSNDSLSTPVILRRKKRGGGLLGGLTHLIQNTVETVVTVAQDVTHIVTGAVAGVLTLDIGKVLSSVINPLADILGAVNDLVVNSVVKGLVAPIVQTVLPVVTSVICTTIIVDCSYGPCTSAGFEFLINTTVKDASCDPILPLNRSCQPNILKSGAIITTTATADEAPDPLPPTLRLTVAVVEGTSCAVLIGLLAFTLIIFLALRIFSVERIPQMCQEIALLVAHILILTLKKATDRPTVCVVTSVLLQFLTLANFTFMILEALQVYVVLQNVVSVGGYFNRKQILLVGWGCPAIITGIMAAFYHDEYTSTYSCWLNLKLGNRVEGGTIYPIVVATGMIMIMAEAATLTRIKPLPFASQVKRNAAMVSQSSLFIILPLNILSWVAGIYAAYDPQYVWLYGTLAILNILLGVFICMFHISSNDEVQVYCTRLWNKICCRSSNEAEKI